MFCDEEFMWISTKRKKKKINDQTKNEEENRMTIISWFACEVMMKQRRFKLTIVLKIVDREKNKSFIVDNTTNEKIKLIIVDDEANEITEKKEKVA